MERGRPRGNIKRKKLTTMINYLTIDKAKALADKENKNLNLIIEEGLKFVFEDRKAQIRAAMK